MRHTLKLRVCEIITVEGNASDLAMYTCFLLDMLTSLAEEKQKKTDQLLLTSPVSLPRIVLGKYLAAVTVLGMAALLTLFCRFLEQEYRR